MSNSQIPNIILRDDNFPLLTETLISQVGVLKNGQDMPFTRLVALKTALEAVDLPPNATTLKVQNQIYLEDPLDLNLTNNITNTNMIITDTTTSLTNSMTAFQNTISDTIATNSISSFFINMVNTSIGNQIEINNDSLQQWINTTCAGVGEINLDCNSNTLFIRNFNSGGYTRLGTDAGIDNSNLILTDNKDLFVNSNTKQFLKFNDAGYGYKPLLVNEDETIQRYMNYVVIDDGITNVYLDTYTNLLDSNTLVSDRSRVGWSCKFCNVNNVDVTISNTDSLNYFSHYGGLSGSPYILKKWTVVELTLIWSASLGQFLYAVSQYN